MTYEKSNNDCSAQKVECDKFIVRKAALLFNNA